MIRLVIPDNRPGRELSAVPGLCTRLPQAIFPACRGRLPCGSRTRRRPGKGRSPFAPPSRPARRGRSSAQVPRGPKANQRRPCQTRPGRCRDRSRRTGPWTRGSERGSVALMRDVGPRRRHLVDPLPSRAPEFLGLVLRRGPSERQEEDERGQHHSQRRGARRPRRLPFLLRPATPSLARRPERLATIIARAGILRWKSTSKWRLKATRPVNTAPQNPRAPAHFHATTAAAPNSRRNPTSP